MKVGAIEANRVGDIPCDLVVVSAGFRPNAELAAEAGVELGPTGAIRTDDRMQTNLAGVYAAGDCAEVAHRVTGRPAYIPPSARPPIRPAGWRAPMPRGGRGKRFPGIVGTSIVGIFGTGFATTGLSVAQALKERLSPVSARIEALERPRYFQGVRTTVELVADRSSGRLLGGSVIGERGAAGRINVIATAIECGMRVEDFEQLDLAYAPPFSTVWDPLLVAAQQLSKEL